MNTHTALFAYEDAAQDVQSINWAIDEAREYADHIEVARLTSCLKAALKKKEALRAAYLATLH